MYHWAHVSFSSLSTLREGISRWISMDPLTQLKNYKSIQGDLMGYISRYAEVRSILCRGYRTFVGWSTNQKETLSKEQVEKIIQRDIDSVVARIMVMLSNDQCRRELVAQKDVGAQALLNLLQEVKNFHRRLPADNYASLSFSIWNILSTSARGCWRLCWCCQSDLAYTPNLFFFKVSKSKANLP
jgi:hypothetical protein